MPILNQGMSNTREEVEKCLDEISRSDTTMDLSQVKIFIILGEWIIRTLQ